MRYCTYCLNTDTRPNAAFHKSGLCFPCAKHFAKVDVESEKKQKEFGEIYKFAKTHNQSGYDCIVGVSGGKDSTRQALHIKEVFGLKPLLVSMNYPPEQISQRGVDNLSNLISKGFDCVNIGCSPMLWRKAMRHAFIRHGNWAKSTEFALFASVPRLAVAYQIPLIFWGESAAALLGEMGVLGSTPYDGNRLKYSNTLGGGGMKWLTDAGFSKKELLQYTYPSDEEMSRARIKIVFMDYFMGEFSSFMNGNFSALRGLSIRKPDPVRDPDFYGTGMLDEEFININMFIRYLKFGFGRTSDNVNIDIRYGRTSRADGIELIKRFDGNYNPEILKKFCAYIGISIKKFWEIAHKFANKKLFENKKPGVYRPKFQVGVGL